MTYKDGSWGEKAKKRSEKRKEYFKNYRKENALRRYGLTEEKYNEILKAQNGGCAVCGKKESARSYNAKNGAQRLSIDHDRKTGEVRGLLCFSCNRGMGYLKDSVKLLESAIRYLKS